MISRTRSTVNRSASSHGTRSSLPSRRRRTWGWRSRSSVRKTGGRCTALAQTSPRFAGWAGSPFTFVTRPSRTWTRSPQPTPQYGHIVGRQAPPSAGSGGCVGLLLEESHDGVAQPEVVGAREQLVAAARPRERHVEDSPDRRGGPVRHHDDPVGEQERLVHVVGHHDHGPASRRTLRGWGPPGPGERYTRLAGPRTYRGS